MINDDLVAVGLTPAQAEAYAYILKVGKASPPQLARVQRLTRTNAYKVLEKLEGLGLARREEEGKKVAYLPNNPLALTNLVAEQRNIAAAREEAVKKVLDKLLEKYHSHTEQPSVHVATGKNAVVDAYKQQIALKRELYFIRSRADIPILGYEVINEIRLAPSQNKLKRFGITPDVNTGPVNAEGDKRSNLQRTWVRHEDYNSPVEWSVCGPTLLIVMFGAEPHAITITSPLIAEAFLQLWHLLDSCLRSMSYYKQLPRTAQEK